MSQKTYHHIAFKIADSDLEKYRDRVKSLDIEFHEGRKRVEGEGNSLYFTITTIICLNYIQVRSCNV